MTTLALPAITPSTRRERNDYWRHWMISASREERWQAGALTEPRTIASGPTIALPWHSGKPRLLDLFCGGGGAGMGYYQAGFDVTGVDIAPQPHYPFQFIQADALQYLAEHGHEFDVIHASPPCQKFTALQNVNAAQGRTNDHMDFIPATRRALDATSKVYVIENVQGAPVNYQIILCGYSLGLQRLARHRHFESNVMLFGQPCSHRGKDVIGVYGERPDGHRVGPRKYKLTFTASSLNEASAAMGIDWMDWAELKESIPPAYTEYIARQLLQAIA